MRCPLFPVMWGRRSRICGLKTISKFNTDWNYRDDSNIFLYEAVEFVAESRWVGGLRIGYRNAADLRAAYPAFFWTMVRPYIDDGLRYLSMTQNGKQWIANLYAHVFAEEHDLPSLGPERVIAVA